MDAYGTVRYFNASMTMVRQDRAFELSCGATLEDPEHHSMGVHIRKWFNGSQTFEISDNEDLERDFDNEHYKVTKDTFVDPVFGRVSEFKLSILSKNRFFCNFLRMTKA